MEGADSTSYLMKIWHQGCVISFYFCFDFDFGFCGDYFYASFSYFYHELPLSISSSLFGLNHRLYHLRSSLQLFFTSLSIFIWVVRWVTIFPFIVIFFIIIIFFPLFILAFSIFDLSYLFILWVKEQFLCSFLQSYFQSG